MKGPSIDQTLRCYGCDYFDVWWNGGPNLHAKCKEKNKFIPGDHKPGHAGDIKTPEWCSYTIKKEPIMKLKLRKKSRRSLKAINSKAHIMGKIKAK